MASTPRWGGLRIEPYDPDARDADGDGIVQEGTAWERPVGLQLIDELGRAIARGQSAKDPVRGLRYVDRSGQEVSYEPKWAKFVRSGGAAEPDYTKQTGLARLGLPSLKDRGHLSILDMQVTARSTMSAVLERPAPVRPYVGKDGAKRFIAEHPEYVDLVKQERKNKINPNKYYKEGLEDKAMLMIVQAQGFDAKPTAVSREQADAIIAQGGVRIFRGIPDPEFATMLRSGDYYAGRGVHGSGLYFALAPGKSTSYLGERNEIGAPLHPLPEIMTEMILRPDAKIISGDELRAELSEAGSELGMEDLGHIAAMRGYDAIFIDESLRKVHPVFGPEYVVLNRGALYLPPQPDESQWVQLIADQYMGRPKLQEGRQHAEQLGRDPEFLKLTPKEKIDYLEKLIYDREKRGLTVYFLLTALEGAKAEYERTTSVTQRLRRSLRRKKP